MGIAIDNRDRVYVTDCYMGVIQVFNTEGEILAVVGNEKNEKRKFITPAHIYIDKNNRLYVVEMYANKISVFDLK